MKDNSNLEFFTDKFRESFDAKWRENKNGCHLWTAARDKDDYGQVSVGPEKRTGRIQRAHIVAYELATGEDVPEGMDLDHTCHIRRCVNADHLEPVPHEENMRRINAVEDWAEDSFKEAKTTPEEILERAQEILNRSNVENIATHGGMGQGYAIATLESKTPWREIVVTEGHIPDDKFSRVKLFLDCVSFGVDWHTAAVEILGLSPFGVLNWNVNGNWREDFLEAKSAGRKFRYSRLEEKHLDRMEQTIGRADFKDVASSLGKLRESDPAVKRQVAEAAAASGAPQIAIIIQGDSVKVLETIAETGDAIEGEFEVLS